MLMNHQEQYIQAFKNIKESMDILDTAIKYLKAENEHIMDKFLATLPFQCGDLVEDKHGNRYFIEDLQKASLSCQGDVNVYFTIRKIKNNGEPYMHACYAWGFNYWDLKKVDNK